LMVAVVKGYARPRLFMQLTVEGVVSGRRRHDLSVIIFKAVVRIEVSERAKKPRRLIALRPLGCNRSVKHHTVVTS